MVGGNGTLDIAHAMQVLHLQLSIFFFFLNNVASLSILALSIFEYQEILKDSLLLN